MIDEMTYQLKNGWNPLLKDIESTTEKELNIIEAIDFALEKKKDKVTTRTLEGYNFIAKYLKESIALLRLEKTPVTQINRKTVMTILERAKKEKNASNNNYNKFLQFFGIFFDEMETWLLIEHNPARKIPKLKIEESVKHNPPTKDQFKKINEFLLKTNINLYRLMEFEFHTGARPTEILDIKIGDIDFNEMHIVINPKSNKNKKRFKYLPINKYLFEMLKQMEVEKYPEEYYLFGNERLKEKGFKYNTFIPSPKRTHNGSRIEIWKKLIIQELGVNVSFYSFKKLGAIMKLKSGMDLNSVSWSLGHSDIKTTKIYTKEIENEAYRKNIMDKSPDIKDLLK